MLYNFGISASQPASAVPLCVDLDGTLIHSDSLWESLLALIKRRPWMGVVIPLWTLKGKAAFKEQVTARVLLDAATLPYNQPLLTFLREEAAQGRTLMLVTAAHQNVANSVAAHIGLFTDAFGTREGVNLSGKKKAEFLVETFGERQFDYVGNADIDLHVWSVARRAIVVNASGRVVRKAGKISEVERMFPREGNVARAFLRGIRAHQWVKNILIFVPLVTSFQFRNDEILIKALLAFVTFSACTSSVYLLNDLLDLASDRLHPRKRFRALASGALPIPFALIAAPLLLSFALGLSLLLPPLYTLVLVIYCIMAFAYSFYLKKIALVDVLVLAGLYALRIVAGHASTGVAYSYWLLLFAVFFFLGLALVKRYAELDSFSREKLGSINGRGYEVDDLQQVGIIGTVSGLLSVLILALYIRSDDVLRFYARPEFLWLLCPLMLYWISRVWLLARRGVLHDDPIVFALKDVTSYVVGALVVATMMLAR